MYQIIAGMINSNFIKSDASSKFGRPKRPKNTMNLYFKLIDHYDIIVSH